MKRVAVVGLGNMGRNYARIASENPRAEIAAVCDVDRDRARTVSEAFGCRPYFDYEEMLSHEKPDGAVISLPDHLHKGAAIVAAELGVNVLLEKPMATSIEDATAIAAAFRSSGARCQMGHIFRWTPPYVAAKEAIDAGELGELVSVSGRVSDRIEVPLNMLMWASRSSPAWFLISHEADAARWFASSEVSAVMAVGIKKKLTGLGVDTYDLVRAELAYASGAIACLQASWIAPASQPTLADARFEVIGTDGALVIDTGYQMGHVMGRKVDNMRCIQSVVCGRLRGIYPTMFDSFVDVLEGKYAPLADEKDGLENVKTLVAIEISLKTGKWIDVKEVPDSTW